MSATTTSTGVTTTAPMSAQRRGLPLRSYARSEAQQLFAKEFVEAYYDAVREVGRNTPALLKALEKRFPSLQPASSRTLFLQGLIDALSDLPVPPADSAERRAAVLAIAGEGTVPPESITFVDDSVLEILAEIQAAEARMVASKKKGDELLQSAGAPGGEPLPPGSFLEATNEKKKNGLSGKTNLTAPTFPPSREELILIALQAEEEKIQAESKRIAELAEQLRAYQENLARLEQEAIERSIILLRGFPFGEMNTVLKTQGELREEVQLVPVTREDATRPRIPGRITLRDVFYHIYTETEARRQSNHFLTDLTVHMMALYALQVLLSEHIALLGRENGGPSPPTALVQLMRRMRHLSSYQHRSMGNATDHSRLLVVGHRYGEMVSITPTSDIYVDPIVAEVLDLTMHPSVLLFLFPSIVSSMRDLNLYAQGRILNLFYENDLDLYLDMRSMSISVYKDLHRVLLTYFAPPRPSALGMVDPTSGSFVEAPASESTLPATAGAAAAAAALPPLPPSSSFAELERAQEAWNTTYGLAREGYTPEENAQYTSPEFLHLLDQLQKTFEVTPENTRNYSGWETWGLGTRTFLFATSLAQLLNQGLGMAADLKERKRAREDFEVARRARANASRAFDPAEVGKQGLAKPGSSANAKAFMEQEAEANARSSSLADLQFKLEELLDQYHRFVDAHETLQDAVAGLSVDGAEAIRSADADVTAECNALLHQRVGVAELPTRCAMGSPLFEFFGVQSPRARVEANKGARQDVLDSSIQAAEQTSQEVATSLLSLVPILQDAMVAGDSNDIEGMNSAIEQANAAFQTSATLLEKAQTNLVTADGVIQNIRNLPEMVGANTPQEISPLLLTNPSELLARVKQAHVDVQVMEERRALIKLIESNIQVILQASLEAQQTLFQIPQQVQSVSENGGGPIPPPPPPRRGREEPQRELDPEAVYTSAVLPGANLEELRGVGGNIVGSAPMPLRHLNERGEVTYVNLKGKDLPKLWKANRNRDLPPNKQWRQKAHEFVGTYYEAKAFAGDAIWEATGVGELPTRLARTRIVPLAGVRPMQGLRQGMEWSIQVNYIPGRVGGIDVMAAYALGSVGLDPNIGITKVGGYVPIRPVKKQGGGGHLRKLTRKNLHRFKKTRKQRGGAIPSLEDLCVELWQKRSYDPYVLSQIRLKTAIRGLPILYQLFAKDSQRA